MSNPASDHGHRPGWCVHYGYNRDGAPEERGPTCAAGVNQSQWLGLWAAVKETGVPAGLSLQDYQPCFLTGGGERKPNAWPCSCLRLPTKEEIEQHAHHRAEQFAKHARVGPFVVKWRAEHKGQDFGEVVVCPVCNGRLHLSIARRNGHIHGKCETAGCVEWME